MSGTGSNPGEHRGGRQKGSLNRTTVEVRELALEHGPAAVAELARLSTAAESETARIQACNAVIERAYRKAVPGRPIILNLPDTSTVEGVTKAVAAIVQAAASGEVTPAEASDFCSLLDTQRRAIELSDIEARHTRLAASTGGERRRQPPGRRARSHRAIRHRGAPHPP